MLTRRLGTTLLLSLFLCVSFTLYGQTVVLEPVGHDVSQPLRAMGAQPPMFENFNLHMVKPIPARPDGGQDGALQTAPIQTSATISNLSGFDGPGVSTGLSISG
jgi:hypothetical protein